MTTPTDTAPPAVQPSEDTSVVAETPHPDATDDAPDDATDDAPDDATDDGADDATPDAQPAIVPAPSKKAKDPLHGITLEMILTSLVERHGWEAMGKAIEIKCFLEDPSIKSSLTFLRRTPWAREKVEHMFITNDLRPAWRKRGKGRGPRS